MCILLASFGFGFRFGVGGVSLSIAIWGGLEKETRMA